MTIELFKIIIPALLVFLASYLALERLLREEAARRKFESTLGTKKISTPIRLQAYERVVLYLERISPESLLIRTNQPGMTIKDLQSALLTNIRNEWEHNLSQQLYISTKAWGFVKNSKDNVIKLINVTAEKFNPNDTSIKLSHLILEKLVEMDTHPTARAVEFLKKEANELF